MLLLVVACPALSAMCNPEGAVPAGRHPAPGMQNTLRQPVKSGSHASSDVRCQGWTHKGPFEDLPWQLDPQLLLFPAVALADLHIVPLLAVIPAPCTCILSCSYLLMPTLALMSKQELC